MYVYIYVYIIVIIYSHTYIEICRERQITSLCFSLSLFPPLPLSVSLSPSFPLSPSRPLSPSPSLPLSLSHTITHRSHVEPKAAGPSGLLPGLPRATPHPNI